MLKVIEIDGGEDSEGCGRYELRIERDGKKIQGFSAGHCEPEDATLERDLNFALSVVDIFRLGVEAGKSGEEITFEERKEED